MHVIRISLCIKCMLRVYILNGRMYVKQPPDFEIDKFPNYVYKLSKALYRLKQSPRLWYDMLNKFLSKNDF